MTDTRPTIDTILFEAIEITDAEARADYLEKACGGDLALRSSVAKMLGVLTRVGAFMEEPVYLPAAEATDLGVLATAELIGQEIGPFKLLEKLGEGGMGVVYLAQQDHPVQRRVALKVIRAGMETSQVIARFEHERQALALMDHPSIARVLDAGATANGLPYFAMEFVHGIPLTTYCDQEHLTIRQRIELLIPVCQAVQHAHQKGIVHRDLKPTNVLVALYDGRPVPKVIDFGVAKATGQHVTERTLFTELGQIVGTIEYMAPEQADSSNIDIDTRADVYSLGVLLYELLTGSPPFTARALRTAGLAGMLRMVKEIEPIKPSTKITNAEDLPRVAANRRLEPRRLAIAVRGELDWISLKCLEKDRARRYETAEGMALDLERYLSNEHVQACPPTAGYRFRKFVTKHRGLLAGASALALLMTAATAVSSWQSVRASRAEKSAISGWKEAEKQRDQANDVNQFMYDVLTSVEPDEKGADVRLVEVLDDASQTASLRFASNPVQEGTVRMMLGQIYTRLDMQKAATAEYDKAVQLLQSALDPDDRRVFNAKFQHARALLNQSAHRPAAKILEELVPRVRATFGSRDILLLDAERLQAATHARAGRYDQAVIELRDLRERANSIAADDNIHIRLLDSLIYVLRMKLDRAPEEDQLILGEMDTLATEMADRAVRTVGIDAVQTLRSRTVVADIKYRRGNFQAAADICTEILATSEDRLGKSHTQRLLAMEVLAKAKHRLGDSVAAAELTLQSLEYSRNSDNAIIRVSNISSALPILDRGGRWVEGESLAREFSAELIKMGGGHGSMLFDADLNVARFVSLQGRFDEAETLFQALMDRKKEAADDPLALARLHLFFGAHLRLQKQFEKAEKELTKADEILPDNHPGTSLINPDDLIVEFIALYDDWGQPNKAEPYRIILDEIRSASYPIE